MTIGDLHRLVYNIPAVKWVNGIPLGNGTTGAMLYGKPGKETLSLNHDRLWRNLSRKEINTSQIIPKIRELCLNGRSNEGEELFLEAISEVPDGINPYQPVGDLHIEIEGVDSYDCYERKLDIKNGIAQISFISNNIKLLYECFVSKKHNALFLRILSDKPEALSCRFSFSRSSDPECDIKIYGECEHIIMEGSFIEGISFAAFAEVWIDNGQIEFDGIGLSIKRASELVLKVFLSTSFNSKNPVYDCMKRNAKVKERYNEIKKNHENDYSALYNRVDLELPGEMADKTTEMLFSRVYDGEAVDNSIYNQMFNMARYLMISSSRPGSLPINLQGIWSDKLKPEWDCSFTMDMNIQMHYWLATTCNLFECQQPLFDWIFSNMKRLNSLAKNIFGCEGIFIPQYTDFKFTPHKGPDGVFQLLWSGAAAWIARHFFEHWRYTDDDDFLFKYAYPFMQECMKFYKDFIAKDDNGRYIVCPSCSPENKTAKGNWLVNTATMDISLIHELVRNIKYVNERFGLKNPDEDFICEISENLVPYPINEEGCLKEWIEDIEELDPYHRHISHIYGIFPGKLFDSRSTPELYEAAIKALYKRRKGGFGSCASWSHAWYACCFARIGDGDTALACIDDLIKSCMLDNFLTTHTDWRGTGATGNFFDHDEKVFQIDAILGAAAAITEMLVQSDDKGIRILPALPASWMDGEVRGIRAYDGFELGIKWGKGIIRQVLIKSHQGRVCRLMLCRQYNDVNVILDNKEAIDINIVDNYIEFITKKDGVYSIIKTETD